MRVTFIVVTGSLVAGTDGISGELYSEYRCWRSSWVIDLLRQAPCETIGRQKTKLISISLVTISEPIKQDDEFNSTIQKLEPVKKQYYLQ